MGLNEFWLQSNNGKKFSLENLKELKKSDLTNNSALEKIFNIFNTNGDEKLDKTELNSLFITMQKAAQSSKGKDTSIFEQNEAEEFIGANKEFKDLNINASDLFEFLSKLVKPEEEVSKEPLTIDKVPFNVNLTEEQAQEKIIQTINEDLANSRGILFDVDNGKVGEKYNKFKNYMYNHPDLLQKIKNVSLYTAPFTGLLSYFLIDNLEDMAQLSLTNIEEAIAIQEIGCQNLTSAKEGKLSKKEYFLQNREHLKIMIKRRLLRKDSAGIDFIDRIKDKENLSRKQLYEQMEFYINTMVNQIESLEELKNMQRTLLVTTDKGCEKFLEGIYAKMKAKDLKDSTVEPNYRQKIAYGVKAPVPEEYNTAEPMTFEEVFKFERNQEYSKAKVENYLRQNQKTNFVTSAYNKYQSFKTASDEILNLYKNESVSKYGINGGVIYNNSQPNPEKQAEKVMALFSAYYENVFEPDLAKQELEKLISENNLKISVVSDGNGNLSLDLSNLKSDSEKNAVLRQLLRLEDKKLSEQLKDTLGGDVEDVLTSISEQVESAYTQAYGHEFTQELTSAMAEDNQTFIQRYTGDVSMTGMGLTVVGGILCSTPLAPLGAAMVTVGNTLAIGGMAAESGLGLYEAGTRTNLDKEEIEELSKTLVMNAGGFVVGMKAAKTGMKAFHKLIDKKLAEVFKTEMVKGNRVEALKQVFANPEYLKSFMKAAGVKLSADFIISYAGDLVMMGVLDTQDDWMSLLQSNLIGILAGMGGDLKDVAHLGMKGDRYRVLRHKEKTQGLTPKEAEELIALRKDPDIKKEYLEDDGVNEEVNEGTKTKPQNPKMILDGTEQNESDRTNLSRETKDNKIEPDITEAEPMSDAEFNALAQELKTNLKYPKPDVERRKFVKVNKDNILFVQILLNCKGLTDKLNEQQIRNIINSSSSDAKKAEAKTLLLEKLQKNPNLLNNTYIADKISNILIGTNSVESLKVLDMLFAKPELLENMVNIKDALDAANNDYSVNFIEKIIENPELFNSTNVIVYLPGIIRKSKFEATNETTFKLFNEFIKDSKNISNTKLTDAFAQALYSGVQKVHEFDKKLENKDNKYSPEELKTIELNREKSLRTDIFENIFLKLSENKEFTDVSNKFYELYLENEFTEYPETDAKRFREMCESINKEYGVKVILPSNLKEVGQSLILVYQELNNYKMHSNNQAKMPPVLDFINTLADNLGGMAHLIEGTNHIDIKELSISFIKYALRHEMAHINDTKQLNNFPEEIRVFKNKPEIDPYTGAPEFNAETDLDIDNCKYVDEFRNAGIPEHLIKYAYSDPKEFVAVASQGDFSKYSTEFKNYLVKLGMPEWMLKFQNLNPYFISRETKNKTAPDNTQKTNPASIIIGSKTTDPRYSKPLTPYTELGNKIFEVGKHLENPEKVKELEIEIEKLRKTEPQKAEELQIVLDMLTNPPKVQDVTDKQIDAVVNYLNDHYDNLEGYFTEQAGEIGISDPKLGRFGHRIKGEWSTRDKIANFIKDAISDEAEAKKKGETYTTKTLFDAFKDVRDKYACRTVFEIGDYTKHPEVASIIKEANALKAQGKLEEAKVKMHQAELKAAELQSEPVRIQLLEAMRKAKEEGKDLTAVRISNYYSEDGIPIFTPAQMHKLKYEAAKMGVDVEFIKLAKEIDPKATTEFVDGASTKKQPSGYTALQINFETRTGEVIEWQYRGEFVNEFAEAEHLPYDLRTGKHPWAQYPELEVLYKPIADLIDEHVMPKHAYKQLNKYFTDYYTHLRRLELGFESEEPKLEDYENYTDKDGVKHSYKFDKRLEAKNLMALHFYGEGIKDGTITPERALEEFNTEVEKTAKSQEQILPESSVKINEKTDIEDIKNLTQMTDRFGFDEWDKKYIVNSVQYKHQIPILNKLLECTYKDYSGKEKHLDGFDIEQIMPKLRSIKDAETITKLYEKYGDKRSWIRTLVTNIDSPYFNLLNKIFETTNMDDSNFNILKAELDTPEKILRAEELMDKLLPSQKMSSESIIKVLSKEINGFDFDKNIKTITEKIETEYGQGTVEAYFNNSLFHIAQKAKTPVQRAAIVELLKYKDKKYFIYEQMNRHYIDRAIEDVLDFIETPEDIKIVNAMFEAKTSDNKNETEIYVSDVRSDIKEILAECKKNRDYLSFVADNARKFFSGEDVIEAMQYAQHISNPEIVTELQKYYTGKPIYNYKTFIDLANDPCKLEAIKFINEFNKNKKQDKQIEITSSLLEYLNDQSSIDYFKFIVDFYKTNNQDRLSYLMEISDSEPKRTAVKMLINYQNKDGSKIINTSTQIKQVLQFIENDSDIQKLSDILTKKKFGFFERTLTFKTVVEEISANPNTKQYVKILKQKYPNVNINEVLQYVKDDNDFNLALKFLEKDRKWDLHLIQKARKNNDLRQALDYILDTNASLIDHIGIDNLTSMKNVYQKVKIMNEAGISYLPYENFKKLKGDYFFTKNYIKDTKSIKEGAKINQFPKDTPLEQILDKVPAGEICTIAGVLHVRENNQLVKLNISLQTYFNLFPRQDRFGTQQGALGDCWLISTMDVLMSSPTGRSKLLQLFSEKDGTVYVTLPNKEAIPFKEGKPISTDNSIFAKHADACTGIRLLEEAVAFVCSGKKVEDISSLADLNKMMNSIVGGQEERGFKLLLGQSGEMPTISNAELFEEILIKYNDNPNVVLRTGINSDVNIPREIASKYDLHNGHAYRIDGYDETSKTVFVVNPHDTRFRIELPLDIYKTYFSEMKLFELNI